LKVKVQGLRGFFHLLPSLDLSLLVTSLQLLEGEVESALETANEKRQDMYPRVSAACNNFPFHIELYETNACAKQE
jgi:hypothetical protein